MRQVVRLENPLSDAQSIMRPTLLGSLLDAARHNVSRNGPDVAIFESGTVYRASADGPLADEHHGLGVLLSGSLAPRSWRGASGEADFFAAKALLGALLGKLHVDFSTESKVWPFLHPGRSAAVLAGPQTLGFVGELHPRGGRRLGSRAHRGVRGGSGQGCAPSPRRCPSFRSFPAVPSLRRDIAVTLPDVISAAEALEVVRRAAGEVLDDVSVFDVYTGEQVGEGRRSLALALSFRSSERTLTDEDIAPVRERILAALEGLGGELRG